MGPVRHRRHLWADTQVPYTDETDFWADTLVRPLCIRATYLSADTRVRRYTGTINNERGTKGKPTCAPCPCLLAWNNQSALERIDPRCARRPEACDRRIERERARFFGI
jgi:hypothetical protein